MKSILLVVGVVSLPFLSEAKNVNNRTRAGSFAYQVFKSREPVWAVNYPTPMIGHLKPGTYRLRVRNPDNALSPAEVRQELAKFKDSVLTGHARALPTGKIFSINRVTVKPPKVEVKLGGNRYRFTYPQAMKYHREYRSSVRRDKPGASRVTGRKSSPLPSKELADPKMTNPDTPVANHAIKISYMGRSYNVTPITSAPRPHVSLPPSGPSLER